MPKPRVLGMIFGVLAVLACSESTPPNSLNQKYEPRTDSGKTDASRASTPTPKGSAKLTDGAYTTIEWIDLLPQEDLDALLNTPEYLLDIEDGSEADAIEGQIKAKSNTTSEDRYQQALVSKTIKPEFNNQAVRIPGFIVPLEFDDLQTVTTFFLVPFFGACIHMPPPPPNQIIYAEFEPGLRLENLHDPIWIEGKLFTTLTENDMATAAYSMTVERIEVYAEDTELGD